MNMVVQSGTARPLLPPPVFVRLVDGSSVRVRPIAPADAQALTNLYFELSAESRYLRFQLGVHEVSAEACRHMCNVLPWGEVAFVAEVLAHGDWVLVADARYLVVLAQDDTAEFALTVADSWQRKGLGTELLRLMMFCAWSSGVKTLFGDVLRENAAQLSIGRRLGGRLAPATDGSSGVRLEFQLG